MAECVSYRNSSSLPSDEAPMLASSVATPAAAGTAAAAAAAGSNLNNGQVQINVVPTAGNSNSIGRIKKVSNKKSAPLMSHLVKRPPVDIEYNNVCYSVSEGGLWSKLGIGRGAGDKGRKTILKGVSGKLKSGELTAIMGPSGAGKSTLMNIMAGYKTSDVTGDILINGKPRNLRKFRKMSCYIMQDDCLSPHLTVAEAMDVAVNLKLGEKTSKEEKQRNVEEIVTNLGLSECMKTRTSKISGGQRKRLAIALELVNNPPVMFFDEPTSGLDSASCMQCIGLLKQLAREGRTIVCTIHQPSAKIFELFDKLIMLCDGQNIYRGSVSGLVPFLGSVGLDCPSYHNPADYVMEVATGEYGQYQEKLAAAVQTGKCSNLSEGSPNLAPKTQTGSSAMQLAVNDASNDISKVEERSSESGGSNDARLTVTDEADTSSVESIDEHCQTFPTTTWTQFRILFVRTFKSILRDETLTQLRLLSHVLIGLLLGCLYWDIGGEASKVYNNSAMLFFCMLFSMFTAMMPTVMTFPLEMATFKREHLNYWYSMKSYYLAKVMADMPFQVFYPVIFVVIVYFMTSQPLEATRLGMVVLMCILTSLVAQSLGLVIGCACDMQSAVYLGPITTIPILLFSGFFVTLSNIPVAMRWLSYVAYVRYGFEGTMLAIYGFNRTTLHCSVPYCHFKYPEKFLEELSLDEGVYWIDVVALVIMFVLLRIIGYFVLRFKLKSER